MCLIKLSKYRIINKVDKRLANLEELWTKFVYQTEFNSEKIKIRNELYDFTKEKLAEFQKKLEEHEHALEEKKVYWENLVHQNETNTLWKIKDCEGNLSY